jgi:cytochrome b6
VVFFYDWIEERLEVQALADDILSKFVPAHVNIFYCFGGMVLTSFLVQAATGFAMTLYYRATVLEAYNSLVFIITEVNGGWIIRSLHRWSSASLVLLLMVHIGRVYLTGGFKKPRELIWLTGVLLSVIVLSFGVTGYSLPWDQVGFWASKILTSTPAALDVVVPSLGTLLVVLTRGAASVGQFTLTRFYTLHTFLLPVIALLLLLSHFIMLRKQGISGPL